MLHFYLHHTLKRNTSPQWLFRKDVPPRPACEPHSRFIGEAQPLCERSLVQRLAHSVLASRRALTAASARTVPSGCGCRLGAAPRLPAYNPQRLGVGQHPSGFTLIELLIAMAVITVGVTGALSLLINSIASAQAVRNEVIGTNLAQEALEIIHNIRDQNVADGLSWSGGMTVGQIFRVEAFQAGFLSRDDSATLNIDADGFYTYGAGTRTSFNRTVAFDAYTDPARDRKITVTVTWPGRTFTATGVITAWR